MSTAPKTFKSALVGIVSVLVGASAAIGQQSTGPMFSTPASRSTVGSPILNDPTEQQGEAVIGGQPKERAKSSQSGHATRTTAPTATAEQQSKNKNWQLQCMEIAKGQKRCQVMGSVLSADMKQVILVMALATDGKATTTQIAVPLGIALKPGIKINVGDKYSTTIPLSRCTSQGCLAEGNVEPALLDAMKTGSEMTVAVATPDGKAIPINLSLGGFRDVFAGLKSNEERNN